jgi:hypothetical protein
MRVEYIDWVEWSKVEILFEAFCRCWNDWSYGINLWVSDRHRR